MDATDRTKTSAGQSFKCIRSESGLFKGAKIAGFLPGSTPAVFPAMLGAMEHKVQMWNTVRRVVTAAVTNTGIGIFEEYLP